MKYCEKCGKELINGICPNCNGENVVNNTIPSQKKTNGYAIVGFVLSFFVSIAGLIVSIIGLKKSKELENGKGLSIAGIIISIVILVFQILVILIVMSGLFFAATVYPEIKKDLNDEIEDRVYDWDTVDDFDNNDAIVDEATTKTDENGNTYYSIDLTKYKEDDEVIFNLSDNYEVKIDIEDVEVVNHLFCEFDMYVNNKKIDVPESIDVSEESLKFYLINDKLVSIVSDDSESYNFNNINIYVIDNKEVFNVNEPSSLYIKNYSINMDKLLIVFSKFDRLTTSQMYGGNRDSNSYICDSANKNEIVEYTEEYDLTSSVLEPVKNNEKTLEQYISENNLCS